MLLDAYAPGLTDNVQRLCLKKGYIVVTHGGGASMVSQANDFALHKEVRKLIIALQEYLMPKMSRLSSGGLVEFSQE